MYKQIQVRGQRPELGLDSIPPWEALVKSSLESGFTVALPRPRQALLKVVFLLDLLTCWLQISPGLTLLLRSKAAFPEVPATDRQNGERV